jgi:hypothetical protein
MLAPLPNGFAPGEDAAARASLHGIQKLFGDAIGQKTQFHACGLCTSISLRPAPYPSF